MSNTATQLPPTISVKDPETRQFLDALVNVLDLRSGNTDKSSNERFITVGNLKDVIAGRSGIAIGAPSLTQVNVGGDPGIGSIADAIKQLEQSIRQTVLYQVLETPINLVNLSPIQDRINNVLQDAQTGITSVSNSLTTATNSLTDQLDLAVSRIGDSEAAILAEAVTRADADTATATRLDAVVARVDSNEAGIGEELSTRANKDNALASAINTIWAEVGGGQALIQDASLASANTVAVQASKWSQVQAAVTDPNTGNVSSTSIKQDLTSYASKVDGTLNSVYSVRATITADGKTLVGGFGLSATQGAGSTAGPTIDFGVKADTFWVGALDGTKKTPFIVKTSATVRPDGSTSPAGVYMDTAMVDTLYGTYINAGLLEAGKIYTGSQYIDKTSGLQIPVVASNGYAGYLNAALYPGYNLGLDEMGSPQYNNSKLLAPLSGNLNFFGPTWHKFAPMIQRCRGSANGGLVNFTVSVSAIVDHFLSIWYRGVVNGVFGAWVCIGYVTEPRDNYGAVSMTASAYLTIEANAYIQFTVAPVNAYGNPYSPYSLIMSDLTIFVTAVNL